MEILTIILKAIKEFIPYIFMYNAGKKSKELEDVKKENETLKEFKKIDELKITKDVIYDDKAWK